MDIKTLTERVIAQADKATEAEIDKMLEPLWSVHNWHGSGANVAIDGWPTEIGLYDVLKALKPTLTKAITGKRRDDAIAAFMQKVHYLSDELREIQEQITE